MPSSQAWCWCENGIGWFFGTFTFVFAARALDFPVVSGNVSLYNESRATGGGSAILPTPAIGGVGLLADWSKSATIAFKETSDIVLAVAGEDVSALAGMFRRVWSLGEAGIGVPLRLQRNGRVIDVTVRSTDRTRLLKGHVLH